MIRWISQIFAVLVFCTSLSHAGETGSAFVEKVKSFREGDTFTADLQTAAGWKGGSVQATFSNDAIQVDIPDAVLGNGKQLIKVEDRFFKSVYLTQSEPTVVRARFSMKSGVTGSSLEKALHVRKDGLEIIIQISGEPAGAAAAKNVKAAKAAKTPEKAKSVTVTDASDENPAPVGAKLTAGAPVAAVIASATVASANVASAANAVATSLPEKGQPANAQAVQSESSSTLGVPAEAKPDTSKLSESQIPVMSADKDSKKPGGGSFQRLMITLLVLATVLGATAFAVKRWAAKSGQKNQGTKIKILTQHYLGPKKSLAIIQVAGETILVGITDSNINMLKTLSLLDEEIPETTPRHFKRTLADFEEEDGMHPAEPPGEDDSFALRGLAEIRDTVSSRLKNMRNF